MTNNGTIAGGTFTSTVNNNGLIYATANVADAGSITYDKTAGNVITYKIGENKYAEQFVKTYSSATKPAIDPTPTQTGYVFGGWYTESECSNTFDFENTSVIKDITLYAQWKENTVPVTPDSESNETPAVTITDEKLTMSETAVEIKSPKTGDSRMFLWLAFLLSSGSTVTIATLACKRRKY